MVQSATALSASVSPLIAEGKVTEEKLSVAEGEIAQLRQRLDQLNGELNRLRASSGQSHP
jgi:hypothetical protein